MGNLLTKMFISSIIPAFSISGFSQSCSSGCVPISNNLGLQVSDAKTIQFSVSYDLNILNTLKEGNKRLNDDARRRLTHSVLFQSGYVINKKWSIELFLSYIRQERIINQFSNTSKTTAEGVGDAVMLVKYKLIPGDNKRVNWLIGAGPKIPSGSSDKKDKNDIALNADLQPGSGAWDAITWTQVLKNFKARPSLTWSVTASYSIKGKNNNYLGSQVYQFGNELVVIGGIADQFLTGTFLWGASLQTIFRYAYQDENNSEKTPGTGGRWIFIRPGFTIKPGKSSAINISASLPAYSWLQDTQLTPTARYNAGFYFEIANKKSFQNIFKTVIL